MNKNDIRIRVQGNQATGKSRLLRSVQINLELCGFSVEVDADNHSLVVKEPLENLNKLENE